MVIKVHIACAFSVIYFFCFQYIFILITPKRTCIGDKKLDSCNLSHLHVKNILIKSNTIILS